MSIRSSAHQDPRRLMVVIKTTVYFVGMYCVADSINPKDSNQFEILFSSYFIKFNRIISKHFYWPYFIIYPTFDAIYERMVSW